MKLLRIGKKGNEKPAAIDKDGKIRDISSHIQDLKPDHLNFDTSGVERLRIGSNGKVIISK